MRLIVGAECSPIKAGIEARSAELRMCGHGQTRRQALESLRRAVEAWARGLTLAGCLEEAVLAAGIDWEPDAELLTVEVEEV